MELRAWRKDRDKDVAKYFFFLFSFSELFIDVILQLQSVNPTQARVLIVAGGSGWFCDLSTLLQLLKTRREEEQKEGSGRKEESWALAKILIQKPSYFPSI